MKLSLFDYHLPPELIAQFPHRRRDRSRLLVLDRTTNRLAHTRFHRLKDHLRPGDALIVNDTRVFKARLFGKRVTGGTVEIFLVRPVETEGDVVWEALARPSRRLKEGETVLFEGSGEATMQRFVGNGRWRVLFRSTTALKRIMAAHGHVPLPQYIDRADQPGDLRRYQTVFADPSRTGAVAAPTAGFHFTRPLLRKIEEAGVRVGRLTLHVGPGTFKPITADRIEDHRVDPEHAELPVATARLINEVRATGGRIFAVGTTSVRTLESASIVKGEVQPLAGEVDLYIKPGHRFRVVDHLVTNFHLPKSSLLVLVSAFAGREQILRAYGEAIKRGYRFYSYGDAMLIL